MLWFSFTLDKSWGSLFASTPGAFIRWNTECTSLLSTTIIPKSTPHQTGMHYSHGGFTQSELSKIWTSIHQQHSCECKNLTKYYTDGCSHTQTHTHKIRNPPPNHRNLCPCFSTEKCFLPTNYALTTSTLVSRIQQHKFLLWHTGNTISGKIYQPFFNHDKIKLPARFTHRHVSATLTVMSIIRILD